MSNEFDLGSTSTATVTTNEKKENRAHLIRTTRNNLQKYGDVLFSLGDALLTWADDVQRESKSNSILRRKEYELEYDAKSESFDQEAMKRTNQENPEDAWKLIQERKLRDQKMFG